MLVWQTLNVVRVDMKTQTPLAFAETKPLWTDAGLLLDTSFWGSSINALTVVLFVASGNPTKPVVDI